MPTFSIFSKAALVGLAGFTLAACANDRVASYVDPAYRTQGAQDYRVAVVGRDMALNEQTALAEAARAEFRDRGVTAFNGMDIVPPTRDLSPEEAREAYSKAGVTAILEITSTDKDVYTEQEPASVMAGTGTRHTTVYRERKLIDGTDLLTDKTYVSTHEHPAYVSGGYSTTRSIAAYTARLIDVSNGKVIWQSDTKVSRSGKNFERHARATAEDFVERLEEDGVILTSNN